MLANRADVLMIAPEQVMSSDIQCMQSGQTDDTARTDVNIHLQLTEQCMHAGKTGDR